MKEICCIKGCEIEARAMGMCRKHYMRVKTFQDPLRDYICKARHGLSDQERFNSWVGKTDDENACWLWKGTKNRNGYGMFTQAKEGSPGKRIGFIASRKAYEYAKGEIPFGMVIRHKCDVKLCCNPKHLEVGTQADNAKDNYERGLLVGKHGSLNKQSKINETIVREIRASKDSVWELAKRYGVSVPLIYKVRHRDVWKQVE